MRNLLIATLASLLLPVLPVAAAPIKPAAILHTDHGLYFSEWLPADFASHHHDVPLILFSHGFGGCAQQSAALTQALADAGYAVLAPDHKDENCESYRYGKIGAFIGMVIGPRPDKPFGHDREWTSDTEISRDHDMEAMLAYALGHTPYREAIDPARIGALGHSLGGYTVLGMAGAWPSLHDPRIKAVAALAPFSAPYLDQQMLGKITVPGFYGAGTDDDLIEPDQVRASYAMAHAPKSLLVLQGADHFSWTDLSPTYQATIAPYVVAFFDRALRHKPTPWPVPNAQVAQFTHAP